MMLNQWMRGMILAVVTIALVVSGQLVGCQDGRYQERSQGGDRPVTVTLSGWGASPVEQRLLQQVLDRFEAEHPQIQVKLEVIAEQYMDVMKTRLIGDAAPDVFYLDALEAPFLMANAVLEPLDSYITPEFELADFEPNLLHPFTWNNQIFGLPKDYSTLALFYNRQAFATAGFDHPPATWEELQRVAKQLTIDRNGDGTPEQYGLGITPELAREAYRIKMFGGEVVDDQSYATFASNAGMAGLQPLVQQYRVDRTAARPIDVGTNSGIEMFGQGKAAMVLEGCWAIPFFKETFPALQYATAEVPQINQNRGTMSYTVAYVMNRQSQHKPEAWALISYLTGKTGMKQWTSSGFALPTRRSVAAQLQYDRDPLRSPLVAGAKYAMPWQIGQYPAAVMNQFNNQFISVLLGEQALQPALMKAQTAANQQIRAAK